MAKKSKKRRGKGIRSNRHIASYKPDDIPEEMKQLLQQLGTHIDQAIGDDVQFSLWLFDHRSEGEAHHHFVSSVEREGVLKQTAAWLAMQLATAEIARAPTPVDRPTDDVELVKPTTEWLASILQECTIKLSPPIHAFPREGSDAVSET